ncbi:hypothetical protein KSD_81400 [Ktedonobacter sp. SOSP1-85]|uniref:G1 family glutamic endopeptidase n=1 Tax=Ktedonobacter sp. SOSP1-85 TaxID=2778367 RepID=UPI001916BE5A|nr:G1 family glutamic endopeptidase [Ktedonobacter sp. SOSP1-85]GHO80369.1 hypothetical protein KSD_81400 [Ktedonobacter sp. SOSP1-85]
MSKDLVYRVPLKVSCYFATALLLLFIFSTLSPATALAHTHSIDESQPVCLQAPNSLDPSTLSNSQLQMYGLPLRPSNAQSQEKWLKNANRIKHDKHVCDPQKVVGTLAHHASYKYSKAITPYVTQHSTAAFAGNYAIGSRGYYTTSNANWNLPCMNTSVRDSRASIWVGLGGFVSPNPLVQAGTDVLVDGNGSVTYYAWIEDTGSGFDFGETFPLSNGCGTTMYVEVDSNYQGSDNNYYIIDTNGLNISRTERWPLSAGDAGECIVERSHDGTGALITLANFNYVAFSNCYMNDSGIGNWNHDYDIMTNGAGQVMADVGPISNGINYHINWHRPN